MQARETDQRSFIMATKWLQKFEKCPLFERGHNNLLQQPCYAMLVLSLQLFLISPSLKSAETIADTVFSNAFIYTVNKSQAIAEAIAISGGRIIYVGDNAGAKTFIGNKTNIIDLGGRMMMPGINDGHLHFLSLGNTLQCSLDYEALTMTQVRERITRCVENSPNASADSLLTVFNWAWQKVLPAGATYSRADLDQIPTQRPIALRATNTHVTVVNSRALELAGIGIATADPVGGKIQRDVQGLATGVLVDAAQHLVLSSGAAMTPRQNGRAVASAIRVMNAKGATSFMEAGSSESSLQAVQALKRNNTLTIRSNFSIQVTPNQARDPLAVMRQVEALKDTYSDAELSPTPGMQIGTLKLFIDGDFMSPSLRGAFIEPYVENLGTLEDAKWTSTGNYGELYFPPQLLTPLMKVADQHGWQIHGHVNGDRAIRSVLDSVEAVQIANGTGKPEDNRRHTFTHLLLIDDADVPRFSKLGVIPSMSLQWPQRDEYHLDLTAPFIGPKRFARIYATRPLLQSGARVAYASDAPVDPLDYWCAMEIAVTRNGEGPGKYAGALNANYSATLEQAIEIFTINSAFQLKQDHVSGSLEVGKFADLIVLDRNLFKIPINEVSETRVLMTMVGGEIVYQEDF
jgi:predicted amidohydrolase YtcJ